MSKKLTHGFTLIETLVAVSILVVAVLAPLALASQSLTAAYYARDQVTAFNLAQEAIEAVRSARDHNVLLNAYGTETDLMAGIPVGSDFTIDTTTNAMTTCAGTCPPLRTNAVLFGYDPDWNATRFTRTVHADWVSPDNHDEMRISVTVSWQTGGIARRTFTISQNLYRWINDGSAAE